MMYSRSCRVLGARLTVAHFRYSSHKNLNGTFFGVRSPTLSSRSSSSRRRLSAAFLVSPAASRYFWPRWVTQTYQRGLPSDLSFLNTRLTHDLPVVGLRNPSRVTRS